MLNWFRSKKSKGGSRILRHGNDATQYPKFGFQENFDSKYAEFREQHYKEVWGESDQVYHELIPLVPHIDVYSFPPHANRSWWVLATGGMSDLPMQLPAGAPNDLSRVELVMYVSARKKEYLQLLRNLAHFPHDNNTWLGPGHTMPNGTPPEPIFERGTLDAYLFINSIVAPDNRIRHTFKAQGWVFDLLHLTPITSAECAYKLTHGINALYDLFDRHAHSFVLNEERSSYV